MKSLVQRNNFYAMYHHKIPSQTYIFMFNNANEFRNPIGVF